MKTSMQLSYCTLILCLFFVIIQPVQAQKGKKNKQPQKLAFQNYIKPAHEIALVYNKFERLQYQLIGHFSNKDQVAEGTTTEPLQEFIVMPILQTRSNEFWVYLEFFSPSLIDAPIDQRFEQYVQVSRDSFRMEVYYPKNPKQFINAWRLEEFPKINIQEDLIRDEVCDLIIAHQDDKPGTFKTVTPEEITCEMLNSNGPARYVDLEFELSDTQYLMWFHFYSHSKKHLKKSDKNGLVFKRLEEQESTHLYNTISN